MPVVGRAADMVARLAWQLSLAPDARAATLQGLAAAARIIRGNVGTEVITVDQGDWDMHVDLGSLNGGLMLNNAHDLGMAAQQPGAKRVEGAEPPALHRPADDVRGVGAQIE